MTRATKKRSRSRAVAPKKAAVPAAPKANATAPAETKATQSVLVPLEDLIGAVRKHAWWQGKSMRIEMIETVERYATNWTIRLIQVLPTIWLEEGEGDTRKAEAWQHSGTAGLRHALTGAIAKLEKYQWDAAQDLVKRLRTLTGHDVSAVIFAPAFPTGDAK